ncbi:DUF1292 domain-containing protein [Fuchsiella alkaliacetigena]|uniref:DUF1292 domain-containing protein n=1 Tax=Fuchsiella alkaliacetigena TaxID=957042 RepID=UPI00200B17C0|nr:DUF1292 domain-containing protein [Fuchsiella alkaliacetigena]MCK8825090.1 DUF1292 domain-containing protein [Fuchsiella alkaliacetigena]
MSKEGKITKLDLEAGVLVLENAQGKVIEFSIEEELEIEDDKYFISVEKEAEEVAEGYAFRLDKDEAGVEVLVPVVDEEELDKIQAEIEALRQN